MYNEAEHARCPITCTSSLWVSMSITIFWGYMEKPSVSTLCPFSKVTETGSDLWLWPVKRQVHGRPQSWCQAQVWSHSCCRDLAVGNHQSRTTTSGEKLQSPPREPAWLLKPQTPPSDKPRPSMSRPHVLSFQCPNWNRKSKVKERRGRNEVGVGEGEGPSALLLSPPNTATQGNSWWLERAKATALEFSF